MNASHFQQLIAPFAGVWLSHDTHVTLKWAEDAHGLVAGAEGAPMQITNATSQRLVHQLRARSAQLVVGIGTVLNDDPQLNVRGIANARQPQRLVLDRSLRLPTWSRLIATARDGTGGHLIALCDERTYFESPRVAELQALGVKVREQRSPDPRMAIDSDRVSSDEQMSHEHIMVEPGPTLARAMLARADRIWVFRSPKTIAAGPTAPRAAQIPEHYLATDTLDLAGDTLTEYLNTRSPAFFAATPSADLVLAAESVARASGT